MIERVRRLLSLGPSELTVLCSAMLVVARTRTALWILPWQCMAAPVAPAAAPPRRPPVNRLEWAVRVSSRFIPRATCLTQALALQRLLTRHGYASRVQIGAADIDGRFSAHAWVEHEGRSLLADAVEITRYSRFFAWPPSEPDLS